MCKISGIRPIKPVFLVALGVLLLGTAAFKSNETVVLEATPLRANVWVWNSVGHLNRGLKIIAQRADRAGGAAGEAWALPMTNCIVPSGQEARFVARMGLYAVVTIEDQDANDGLTFCNGVVLIKQVRPEAE